MRASKHARIINANSTNWQKEKK